MEIKGKLTIGRLKSQPHNTVYS